MTVSSSTRPAKSPFAGWGLLFVLSGNMLLDALEVSIVIVALPSMAGDLHLSPSAVQWVMSGFALGFGGLLLFGGRVVAALGRRRVYLAALACFVVLSLAGGLLHNAFLLVAVRFAKGCCVALTAPTGLAIIGGTFAEGPARDRAVGVYSFFGALGFSVGLVLSGLLTEIGWRWTILFPAPVAVLLFLFGLRFLPRDSDGTADPGDRVRPADLGAATAVLLAAPALVYAVSTGPRTGWGRPDVLAALVAAVLCAAVFVLVQRNVPRPLVRPGLLLDRALLRSGLGAATLNGSYWGFLFICTFHLQALLRWSPWQTALAILPASLLPALAAPFSGHLVRRVGAARLIVLGAAAAAAGYLLHLALGVPSAYAARILPTMVLVGLGFVFAFSALHAQATAGRPPADQRMVSGAYQTSVQLGGAVTLALVAALVPAGPARTALAGYGPALVVVAVVGTIGFLVALAGILVPQGSHPVIEENSP